MKTFLWRLRRALSIYLLKPVQRSSSWLIRNFARLTAVAVLGVLVWTWIKGEFRGSAGTTAHPSSSVTAPSQPAADAGKQPFPSQQLTLLLVILGVAVFVQIGEVLLRHLKKVGPVEFYERQAGPVVSELRKLLEALRKGDSRKLQPSKELSFHLEQANQLVSNLQFSRIDESQLTYSDDLHRLLFAIADAAYAQEDWTRVINRLEFLLRISDGRFQPYESYRRCLMAYQSSAQKRRREPDWEEWRRNHRTHFERALELSDKALSDYKDDYYFHFAKAYALDGLGLHVQAIRSNEEAIQHSSKKYAPAKYNKAISEDKQGWHEAARESLRKLHENDIEIQDTVRGAEGDPDLEDLLKRYPKDIEELFAELKKSWQE